MVATNVEEIFNRDLLIDWPHQWHTAALTRSGQWTKVQLLCKGIHYIRLQRMSSSQIINAEKLTEDVLSLFALLPKLSFTEM